MGPDQTDATTRRNRKAKWRDDGTLERVFHTLSGDEDMENLSMDSTCIKVHESANGGGKNGR